MLTAARAELLQRRELLALGGLAVFVAAVLGAGSAVAPAIAVAAVAGLLFVAVTVRSLGAGLALFTVVIFFDRTTLLTNVGLSPVKLTGVVLAAAWLALALDPNGRVPMLVRSTPRFALVAVLFLAWAFASVVWAADAGAALSAAGRLALVVMLPFIVFSAVRDRRHVRWLVAAFIGGALFAQLIALTGIYTADAGNSGRLAGGFDDPNELAAVLVPAITFAGFAFVVARRVAVRVVLASSAALFGLALIQTDSQAGILAFGVALVLALVFSGSARKPAAVAIGTLLLAATFYYTFVTPPVLLQTITSEDNVGSRESLWTVAGNVAGDHPVLGVGAGNFVKVSARYTLEDVNLPRADRVLRGGVVHNTYLELLAELGPLGLAAFLALVAASLACGVRAVRLFAEAGDRELEMVARAVVVGTTAMLAASTFATATYEKQLWLLLALGPVLSSFAARASRAGARRQPRLRSLPSRPAA